MKFLNKQDGFLIAGILLAVISEFLLENSFVTIGVITISTLLYVWTRYASNSKLLKNLEIKNHGGSFERSLSDQVHQLKEGMHEAGKLIKELGKEGDRKFYNLPESHPLAHSIIDADQQLKSIQEKENRRKWIVEGVAKFGELLRAHDESLEKLSGNLISQLVKYLEAAQAGIFIYREENNEKYLELIGSYALNEERNKHSKIDIEQGLIGQCFLENKMLEITDIPDSYTKLSSGLGSTSPNNLTIVPLTINERTFGVMEFASFEPMMGYKIKFIEQVAKNIASVFASYLNKENTEKLLESSQSLTKELQEREDDMKQNMEELSATQDEMSRKQVELDGVISAINNSLGLAEFDLDGNIIHSNDILNDILKVDAEKIKTINYKYLTGMMDVKGVFLKRITNNYLKNTDYKMTLDSGEELWLNMSFSPMRDINGNTDKILVLVQDITARKQEEIEFEKLSLVADNTDNSVIITDKEGRVEYVNHGFTEMTGYTLKEVLGKKPGHILQGPDTNQETVERIREGLKRQEPVYDEILNYSKSGETYWISIAINPVFDDKNRLEKFISIQANITETKKKALDFSYKLQAISKSNSIIEFDTNGNILDANDNFLKIFGYKKEEVIGKHHEIFIKKSRFTDKEYRSFWSDLKKGKYASGEFERVKKDGTSVWLKGIYNPIFDINGNPYKIIKFAVDITKEKSLKLETQKHEAELNNQMEAINNTIASVAFDMEGNLMGANEIFLSITGIPMENLYDMTYMDLVPELEKDKPQTKLMWQNLREGKFFSGEFKLKDTNGKELWLTGTFNPINDINNTPYKVMMYAQFNTNEKEKQKNLQGMVNAFKSTTFIMELNPDGTFKSGNELFFKEFGYKRLELRQKTFDSFLSKEFRFPPISEILNQLEDSTFAEHELVFLDSTGMSKTYRTTFTAIKDLEEKLSKVVVILIDRNVVLKV